jgi:hypothetical protein
MELMLVRDAAQLVARHFQEEFSLAQGNTLKAMPGAKGSRAVLTPGSAALDYLARGQSCHPCGNSSDAERAAQLLLDHLRGRHPAARIRNENFIGLGRRCRCAGRSTISNSQIS